MCPSNNEVTTGVNTPFLCEQITHNCRERESFITSQPTTFEHINLKYIWSPHGKPYGNPALITYTDLQKVNTLNKYHFPIFIYYKETMKNFVTHIN